MHAVTRTVRDCAVLLDVSHGPAPGDPTIAPAPSGPYVGEVSVDPGRLRIGWSTVVPTGTPIDPACVTAVERTAALLEGLRHDVVPSALAFDASVLTGDIVAVWAVGNAGSHDWIVGMLGCDLEPDELEPTTWELVELGKATSAVELAGAIDRLQQEARHVAAFFETYDLWLTPTLGQPPAPLGTLNQSTAAVPSGGSTTSPSTPGTRLQISPGSRRSRCPWTGTMASPSARC
jgi:amidase